MSMLVQKHDICEKDYIWNPSICICENQKYLASIMDNSTIICDEVIDVDDKTKTISTNFNENKLTCKTQKFCILFASLLITIVPLRAVSIYCYLIKYQ